MRQKKGGIGLSKRVDYGVSSTKTCCIIWTAKGRVKCMDVRLALKVGSMMVLRQACSQTANQGGTADRFIRP